MTQQGRVTLLSMWYTRSTAVLCLVMFSTLLGCGDPTGNETYLEDPGQLFWKLELNHRAINLSTTAPYDTITLVAVAKNINGEVFLEAPAATLVSSSDRIITFPNGVVRGLKQTSTTGEMVVATTTFRGVTRSDTAWIVVTDVASPPKMKNFSIQLASGDSAVVPGPNFFDLFSSLKVLKVRALDSSDIEIPRVVAYYQSSEPSIGYFTTGNSGKFQGFNPGTSIVRVSATVYGVSMRDSLRMIVTYPLINALFVKTGQGVKRETNIPIGGGVYWVNATDDSLDIVFDEPEHAAKACCTLAALAVGDHGGNIAPFIRDPGKPVCEGLCAYPRFARDIVRGRSFFQTGRYKYHSTRNPNVWGTIVVQ